MRLGRLAIPITVVGVVLMLAGAGTAPAAARVREPGVVAPSPAPMNLPAGPMAMDQPETSAASGPSSELALRVSSDSATPPARTWFPLEGLYPPDSPITSSFVKNGPAVAVAVLETVKPSVPVEGPDLRIVTAGAGRDAAGRTGVPAGGDHQLRHHAEAGIKPHLTYVDAR